ncbi:hypothetical protein Tco_0421804 [Tanacetum coccineum]
MILKSVKHGPLIWPTIEENGVIRTKKYAEYSAEKSKLIVIYEQLPISFFKTFLADNLYHLENHNRACLKIMHTSNFDQLHAYLEQHELHANEVPSSRFPSTNNQLRTSSNPRNQATIQDGRVTVQQVQGRQGQNYSGTTYKGNARQFKGKYYKCEQQGLLIMLQLQGGKGDIWQANALSLSDQMHAAGLRMALTASFAAKTSMSWATSLYALDLSILIRD